MNLELLREQGFKVYHDIIGKDFNLDHVLVGFDIYVIETKTYSKPLKGQCKVVYDGEKLSYNGTFESDKPIIQAKAGANWLKNYLKETTKKNSMFSNCRFTRMVYRIKSSSQRYMDFKS